MGESFDLIGSEIGHYRVVSLIGSGGMGVVYDAVDDSLGRHVAIKILKSDAVADRKRVSRFIHEARAASALNHPNLISIYEIGEFRESPFIAMEKIEGSTLREMLSREPLPVKRAVELMLQISEAVGAAHSAGIVHRDLKPENVMVSSFGYVKVLDFGLAKLLESETTLDDSAETLSRPATESGALLGTAGYMSPEQALGKAADHRADIFALGCILYELLTGTRAFHGATVIDTLHQTIYSEPAPLQQIAPAASHDLQRIVRKALAKEIDRRYQSVKEMTIDLRDVSPASDPALRVERPTARSSIAVLPFENATRDAQNDYLVDGITETLIHRLSEFRGLRVMARSTVFRFRNRSVDPVDVGRQLGVGVIVGGRVTVAGDRLSVDVELVDTGDGACLWGKRFDHPLNRIEETQEEIVPPIAELLRVRLSPSQDRAAQERRPVDREAYRLYLQGRFWWNKRPQEGFIKGVELFQKAIECDPLFALAYSGIADAYATLGSWESGLMAPHEAMPRARAAAKRAIELNPDLADPWASLGYILLHYDWEWEESRAAFARAIELNPNCVNAHHWVSHLHTAMRSREQSLHESFKTSDLDPLDLIANAHLAWHYWLARDAGRVLEQSRKTATLEPHSFWPLFFEGLGFELLSDLDHAAEKFREAVGRVPTATFAAAALGHVLGRQSRHAEAAKVLADLNRLAEDRYVPAYDRAIVTLGMGQIDVAFDWLQRAYEERSGWLAYVDVEPRLDPLREHARFADLRRRLNLR